METFLEAAHESGKEPSVEELDEEGEAGSKPLAKVN